MKRGAILLWVGVFLAAAALIVVLFWIGPWSRVQTVPVVLPDSIPESMDDNSELQKAEITPETVQATIASLTRAEAYSRTVTIHTYWSGGSSTETTYEWRRDGATRLRTATRNVLILPDGLWIWYEDTDGYYHCTSEQAGYARADEYLRSLTYEDMLALPERDITGAGYIDYAGVPCIYAEYSSGTFNYRNRIYVSVETGLLMGCETFDGDTLVYNMISDTPILSEPSSELFLPPA